MPGASEETRRVKIINANWTPADAEGEGHFEVMLITEDEQRYFLPASAASLTALVALARAETVMEWDPQNRTLIVANILGVMPWTLDQRL